MFEGYKPTEAERAAIEKAFAIIDELTGRDSRTEQFAREEARGCGNASDRIPLIAARGMCCKWFLRGWQDPAVKLADTFMQRPAAIWFEGHGAKIGPTGKADHYAIEIAEAVMAYGAAFSRMLDADKAI